MTLEMLNQCYFPPMLGGRVCLNFVNLAEYRSTDHALDFLKSSVHVLAWTWKNQLISDVEAENLLGVARESDVMLAYAVDLRELLYQIFVAWIAHEPLPLAPLNVALEKIPPRQLHEQDNGVLFVWNKLKAERPLWPILLDAVELLTTDQLHKVRQCPNCGWLFVDTSRNGARRWCSMDYCGSKVKSRRQYERKLQSKT